MPTVEIRNLKVSYFNKKKQETEAIKDFTAYFPDGQVSVILGESGCGKTTLLKTISGLLDYNGQILVNGVDYSTIGYDKRSFAVVNQDIVLYPIYNIYDNIAFPLNPKKYQRSEIDGRVKALAKAFNIEACLTRLPKQISIGQAQRVAIAKALVKDPELLLFDEPLSNLDPAIKEEILHYIKQYVVEKKATLIYVTHSIREALQIADHIFVMADGQLVDEGDTQSILESEIPETQLLIHKGYLDDETPGEIRK